MQSDVALSKGQCLALMGFVEQPPHERAAPPAAVSSTRTPHDGESLVAPSLHSQVLVAPMSDQGDASQLSDKGFDAAALLLQPAAGHDSN